LTDESDAGSFRPLTTGAGRPQNLIILFVKLTFHYILEKYFYSLKSFKNSLGVFTIIPSLINFSLLPPLMKSFSFNVIKISFSPVKIIKKCRGRDIDSLLPIKLLSLHLDAIV